MKRGWLVLVGIGLQVAAIRFVLRLLTSPVAPPTEKQPFDVPEENVAPAAAVPAELFRGFSAPGWVTFGLREDGTLQMTDVDGGRFEGRLVGTRATLRAARATSSFDIDFTTLERGRRRVRFRGGRHDARTLDLEPLSRRTAVR